MKKNILAIALLLIGTTTIWTVVCYHWFGCTDKKNVQENVQKQDSIINYNAGEYDRLLQEQIELYAQLRTYEDAQLKAKTTYKRTRDSIVVRDTVTIVDVRTLVSACDSVIEADSLVINNLKEQINIEGEKINNLQEVVEAYEQKTELLNEEINTSAADKKKLEKQKKRRTGALVVASSVAILSTFVLSVLL